MTNASRARLLVLLALGTAGLFEVLTLLATQVAQVRRASPWQDDPSNTAVSVAVFSVPMLAAAICLRLLAWNAPGGIDRPRQTLRAAGAMTALVGLTLAAEWAAVAGRAHRGAWNGWTTLLLTGLAVLSVLVVALTAALARRARRGRRDWRDDWLADVLLLCRRVPALRRWAAAPALADGLRRHALALFCAVSMLAAAGVTVGDATGEGLHDPLFVGWLLVTETACNLALCLVANAAAGFVARKPARNRRRATAETSLVAGTVGLLLAVAFHHALWSALGTGGTLTVPGLVAMTLGAGTAVGALCAGLLLGLARRREPPRPAGAVG